MTLTQNILFAIACLLTGLSKGGLGGPLPILLIVPMLSTQMLPQQAVALITPFLILADAFALPIYWRKWDNNYIRLMLPIGIVGAIMAGLLLPYLSANLLKIIIASITAIAIAYKLLADRLENVEYQPANWHGYLAGWTAAFTSTLAGAGSPPFTIYLVLNHVKPIAFMGTATLFFAIMNLLKVPIYIQGELLRVDTILSVLWAIPIVPIGVWLGRKSLDYINPKQFERLMLVLLAGSVVLLLATLER